MLSYAYDDLAPAPRLASAQGYVDHTAYWVDALGLASHVVTAKDQGRAEFVHNRINHHKAEVLKDWNAGRINMTDGQVSHIQAEHWPREMHRGTALDRELKNRVENDRILSGLGVSPTPQGAQGADFKLQLPESKQETWIDLTTEKQWPAHYNRYGGVEGIGEHLYKATYNSAGYSGPMDIKGKVF